MNRKSFLAWLFAPIAAAQVKQSETIVTSGFIDRINDKPLNNQCPVCGEMAAPYKAERICEQAKYARVPGESDYVVEITCEKYGAPLALPPRIARCARCNAAFWQDAE